MVLFLIVSKHNNLFVFLFHSIQASNIKMQELQSQLDRLARDKMLAESRVTELLPYQSEVNKLKNDIIKMQVRIDRISELCCALLVHI